MTTDVRQWPGMRSEYCWVPAGPAPTHTGPNQIGVSFSQHKAAVYRPANRTIQADIPGGAVFVTGAEPITWLRISETTVALEIYPDPGLLRRDLTPAIGVRDGLVLAVCSTLARAHRGTTGLSDIAANTLAHKLAAHFAPDRRPSGRLERSTVDRIAEFVDAELSGPLTIDRLAAVARLSPFHFARAFRATTGMAPHEFVTTRRMQRATSLLLQSNMSVIDVAHSVGLSNVGHFRRLFRRHLGVLPGELRERPQDPT
jgi:AraC family transcriptional regulator